MALSATTPTSATSQGKTGERPRALRPVELVSPRPTRGRLALGTLFTAAAVVGTAIVVTRDPAPKHHLVLVAQRDIAPGERVTAADVKLVGVEVPPELLARSITNVGLLEQPVYSVTGVSKGDLLAGIELSRVPAQGEEFSVEVPRGVALGGRLQPGDRIAFLVTTADDQTRSIEGTVTHLDTAAGTLNASRSVWLTAIVSARNDAAAVQVAARNGTLGVVHPLGTANADLPGPTGEANPGNSQ